MSFFKKLTRSRQNSYAEDDYDERPSADYDPNRPPSSWKQQQQQQQQQHDNNPFNGGDGGSAHFDGRPGGDKMYQSGVGIPQQGSYQVSQRSSGIGAGAVHSINNSNASGGVMTNRSSRDGFVDVQPLNVQHANAASSQQHQSQQSQQQTSPTSGKFEALAPGMDALARVFQESVRPYTDKIESLEQQVADLQAIVDQLEQERLDVFAWIDKRGIRADVPPNVSIQMDAMPGAAEALNGQLDRKITIVNFDLHRLQDDLNDAIASAHFAASMTKFLPDIHRLAAIPGGPRYAYDLVIKLVGNLNSHGGLDPTREHVTRAELDDDAAARADFYARMDDELTAVVRARAAEGEAWDVQKEVRRFERNAAFLKNIGIDTYFPRTLDVMKREIAPGGGAPGAGAPQQQQQQQ